MSTEEKLMLSSAEPINDGGRRWNKIYYISAIAMFVLFIASGLGFGGGIFGIFFGLVVGWFIKNLVARYNVINSRNLKFAVNNKIEYAQLIHELIPRLTPLGALVEKNKNGIPIVEYQGSFYDIYYNKDDSFCIWWRQNIARAFFSVNYIKIYRREVAAMGIIGYHVQQICASYDNKSGNEVANGEKICVKCGAPIMDDAKFCVHCGKTIN